MIVALSVLLILVEATSGSVLDQCRGVHPIIIVADSAEGFWWTVAATPMRSGQCGMNNNQPPCSCTGFKFTSSIPPPYIPKYNSTVFGHNMNTSSYDKQEVLITLINETEPRAVFYLKDISTGVTTIVASLGTDDHNTFIVLYVCGVTSDGQPIVIVLAKSKYGLSSKSQESVDNILKTNNISKDILATFANEDCP